MGGKGKRVKGKVTDETGGEVHPKTKSWLYASGVVVEWVPYG